MTLDFSRPGKPTDNALIESFNGRLRAECLNESWFLSLDDAREKVEAWREDYNQTRPHSSWGNRAPSGFPSRREPAATAYAFTSGPRRGTIASGKLASPLTQDGVKINSDGWGDAYVKLLMT